MYIPIIKNNFEVTILELINYSLEVTKKTLLENVNIRFDKGHINHILGANGVGKSCFSKSLIGLFDYKGTVSNIDFPVIIGSYSNIPLDLTLLDLIKYLRKKYDNKKLNNFIKLLQIDNFSDKELCLKSLSDGQKQKIKLLCFLIDEPKFIILDEFTTSLDKKSTLEIYDFLKVYVKEKNVLCLNITHNLSDIEYMTGEYFYFGNKNLIKVNSKEEIFNLYIKGEQ